MKLNHFPYKSLFGAVIVFLTACNIAELEFDDIKLPNHQGGHTVYIGETTYTISDLVTDLNDSSLSIAPISSSKPLTIVYRDTSVYNNISDLVALRDVTNPDTIRPRITIPPSPIDVDMPISVDLLFEYQAENEDELDSVWYARGIIKLEISSSFEAPVDYHFKIDDIIHRNTGEKLMFSGRLPANATVVLRSTISNYKTLISRVGKKHKFGGTFDGVLKLKVGDQVQVTDQIVYTLTIESPEFSSIFGWFGQQEIEVQSKTLDLSFFDNISAEYWKFNDPIMNFHIENSIGLPIALILGEIAVSNTLGEKVVLKGGIVDNPPLLRSPTIAELNKSLLSIITIDNTTNIRDLLSISPNKFTLKIGAKTNHNNASTVESHTRNFINASSKISVISELIMPLDVQLLNFSRDFKIDVKTFDFDKADTIKLVLITENMLPLNASIGMQFLDENSVSLFDYPEDVMLILSPTIGPLGKTTEVVKTTSYIPIYKGRGYQELLDASMLNLTLYVNSYEVEQDKYVKVYPDYQLKLTLALQGNLNIKL